MINRVLEILRRRRSRLFYKEVVSKNTNGFKRVNSWVMLYLKDKYQ